MPVVRCGVHLSKHFHIRHYIAPCYNLLSTHKQSLACGFRTINTTSFLSIERKREPSSHISLENLRDFCNKEPDFIKRLNSDLAHPYVDVQELLSSQKSCNESPLLELSTTTVMARPGFDFEYIVANIDSVKNNAVLRNTALHIDFVEDVVKPYKRLELISEEMKKYELCKDELAKSAKQHDQDGLTLDRNIKNVYFAGCISKILSLIKREVEKTLYSNVAQLPNKTHEDVPKSKDPSDKKILESVGKKQLFNYKVYDHIDIAEKLQILRQRYLAPYIGMRNYYLSDTGAELEQALVQYTLKKLKDKGFVFMTTPNIIREGVFEGTGIEVDKMGEMVYYVDGFEKKFCLAGTSEIGLCAYFANHSVLYKYLPLKMCAVSTCYRKETGSNLDPKGIFRVHQFQKVEMFSVTANETGLESYGMHNEFVSIQKELYEELGLHFNVVDIPSGDLGLSAYRKIDIEAWFPGRNKYDEISSASNCTDFQSRRLQIAYEKDGKVKYAHTVNATACAAQRLIIALLENGQQEDKTIKLPECIVPYMYGKRFLKLDKRWTMNYIGPQQSKRKHITSKEILHNSKT